ncbi:D-glucuronyl C5-epimerase family protein [Streptomyces sp. NPDC051018]|uniref:D-glucuronyl C5-epimerase family protein n=1 Tax=Streptomyces sp. NPDC051018 TaxID=3365639 RepID=UPI003797CC8F
MAGKRRADLGRRRFIRLAGGTAAGAAVAGGGTFTALASGVFDQTTPDPFGGMPRSLALSLPSTGGSETTLPDLPEQLADGTVTRPDPSVARKMPRAESAPVAEDVARDVPAALPFDFKRSGYKALGDLPEHMRPWRDRPTRWSGVTPNSDNIYLDAEGVLQYRPDRNSPGYDQPVSQIQFALGCITSYRKETDPTRKALFLKRAKAQAKRLIDRRVEARGGWYFPYPFNFTLGGHPGVTFKAPWYSGMAQGEALSLFVQLSQLEAVTEQERTLYRTAADGAFATLLRGEDGSPWVVNKDRSGYLWIQEYPGVGSGVDDNTYNGMIFAMLGLWDYIQATGSELAAQLYDGCCTTIARYFPLLRNSRWYSYYCQTHRVPHAGYHQHHIVLLRQLHWQTGSPVFANRQDVLIDDYPYPFLKAGSVVALAKGTHTLYQFKTNSDGSFSASGADRILRSKKVTFSKATSAPASMRRRIQRLGIYCRISSGPYKDWWVGEFYPNAFVRGEFVSSMYRPHRTLTFPANKDVIAYKFGTNGSTGTTKKVRFNRPSKAPFDCRAVVNGRPMCRITAGGLTGYWVPSNDIIVDGA